MHPQPHTHAASYTRSLMHPQPHTPAASHTGSLMHPQPHAPAASYTGSLAYPPATLAHPPPHVCHIAALATYRTLPLMSTLEAGMPLFPVSHIILKQYQSNMHTPSTLLYLLSPMRFLESSIVFTPLQIQTKSADFITVRQHSTAAQYGSTVRQHSTAAQYGSTVRQHSTAAQYGRSQHCLLTTYPLEFPFTF
jgi:hypothetical protein